MKHDDKPTPGPWVYDGFFTVTIPTSPTPTKIVLPPADARAVSALPDLLKTVPGLVGAAVTRLPDNRDVLRGELDAVNAALAKAVRR